MSSSRRDVSRDRLHREPSFRQGFFHPCWKASMAAHVHDSMCCGEPEVLHTVKRELEQKDKVNGAT